jgi:hypothetical protein
MSILGSGDDGNMTADLAQFDLTREIADSEVESLAVNSLMAMSAAAIDR